MALTAAGLGATATLAFRPQGPPGSQHDAPRGAGSGLRVWGSRQGGLQAGSPHAVQGRPSSQDAATPSHPAGTVMMTSRGGHSQLCPTPAISSTFRVSPQCWASYDEPEG